MSRDSLVTSHDAMVHLRHGALPFLTACGIKLFRHPSSVTDKDVDCMACIADKDVLTLEELEGRIAAALHVPKEFLFNAK